MDFNKLTIKSQEAIAAAQEDARRRGNPEIYPEHLLLGLLGQELPRELVPDPTELAEQGKLDPVIGRDEEIRRVIQVLSRRTKNNPVLIGDPGVGKTAIVEG